MSRTALITGGTSGIGKHTAIAFAENGYDVFITARNAVKGSAAVKEIIAASNNRHVAFIEGDLSTMEGCYALVEKIRTSVTSLQVLINNAGVWMTKKEVNKDGFEMSFMVNYMASYILSVGLADVLKPQARILNVNSATHVAGKFDMEKTPFGHDFGKLRTYTNTKMANALLTINLAGQLKPYGITVNAFHPGGYTTSLGNLNMKTPFGLLMAMFLRSFAQPLKEAGKAPLWLAGDESLQQVTGQYFKLKRLSRFAKQAYDKELAKKLQARTMEWVNMKLPPILR